MAYEKTKWENEKTPLSAENLNHMEEGIQGASDLADALEVRMKSAEDRLSTCEGDPDVPAARLTAVEHEVAELKTNKAPAGYGLGGSAKIVTDMDEATASGFYALSGANCTKYPGNYKFAYGTLLVENRYNTLINQTFNYEGIKGTRSRSADTGEWSEFEFSNPPMELGVEYRTSERWMGKPVFVKLVDCETITSGAEYRPVTDATSIIRFNGYLYTESNGYRVLPIGVPGVGTYYATLTTSTTSGTKLYATTDKKSDGLSGQKLYVQVWYVK